MENHLTKQYKTSAANLSALRKLGWIIFFLELLVFAFVLNVLSVQRELLFDYFSSLIALLSLFYVVPALFRRSGLNELKLHGESSDWTIGKYSEKELRRIVTEAISVLPEKLRNIKVYINKDKDTNAYTYLSQLFPGWDRRKEIHLTGGSLHYLEPSELKSILYHEIGHHLKENKISVYGGWLFTDVFLHGLAFMSYSGGRNLSAAIWIFVLLKKGISFFSCTTLYNNSQTIEHGCDLYSAKYGGKESIINALLKMGEENELEEVLMARTIKKWISTPSLCAEDLADYFYEARPYGRLFHKNLFRHAAVIQKKLYEDVGTDEKKGQNTELNEILDEHKKINKIPRIRWRKFDKENKGNLSAKEISALCSELIARPDLALVRTESEFSPSTHPPFRSRILLIHLESQLN